MSFFRIYAAALLFLGWAAPVWAHEEVIVVSGGPSLRYFDEGKAFPHDAYWGNFVDAAATRIDQIKKEIAPGDLITWFVYRPSYVSRGREMQTELIGKIEQMAARRGATLRWFESTDQLVDYMNRGINRTFFPIGDFEYFGHSNRACFLFDFSNAVDGMSVCYLHISGLPRLQRSAFSRHARAKSWGCYSGETYSRMWRNCLGFPMVGAIGRSDYVDADKGQLPVLSSKDGKWVE